MRNKKIILCLLVFILMLAMVAGTIYVNEMLKYTYKTVKVNDYGLQLKYPRAYEDVVKNTKTDVEQISNQIEVIVEEYEKSGDGLLEFTEELINTKSKVSNITLLIEGIKKEKSTKTLEQICKDYIVMFKVFNSNPTIKSSKYEEVVVNGKNAGRVEIYIEGKDGKSCPGIISYLFPLNDREITITFMGTEKLFANNKNEINKIVDSIKIK